MTHNDKLEHTTRPGRALGFYSMFSSCKIMALHKWSLKFSQNAYEQEIRYLFQVKPREHT